MMTTMFEVFLPSTSPTSFVTPEISSLFCSGVGRSSSPVTQMRTKGIAQLLRKRYFQCTSRTDGGQRFRIGVQQAKI